MAQGMNLKKIRKKYVGKTIDVDKLNNLSSFVFLESILSFKFMSAEGHLFQTDINLDYDKEITSISPMTRLKFYGDDPRHVYARCRVHTDDYEMLDEQLGLCILEDETKGS